RAPELSPLSLHDALPIFRTEPLAELGDERRLALPEGDAHQARIGRPDQHPADRCREAAVVDRSRGRADALLPVETREPAESLAIGDELALSVVGLEPALERRRRSGV